jgi:hypothetical protein
MCLCSLLVSVTPTAWDSEPQNESNIMCVTFSFYKTLSVDTDPNDGDRTSLRNVGTTDRPRRFYNIHAPWKIQILHNFLVASRLTL